MAHRVGATVLVDGAQSVSHMKVDVQDLGADFFVFSGHKVFAPTGIGVLWGRKELLDSLPPWQVGGNMIRDVTFERSLFHNAPQRFEAGTGNIADAVGLGAAHRLRGADRPREHLALRAWASSTMRRDFSSDVPGLTIIGTCSREGRRTSRWPSRAFRARKWAAHLNKYGIAVRSGHHCAQPILRRFGLRNDGASIVRVLQYVR